MKHWGEEELWEWQLRTAIRSSGNHPGAVAGIYSGHRPGGLSPQPVGSEVPLRWAGFENPGTEILAHPLACLLACLPGVYAEGPIHFVTEVYCVE